MPHPHASRRKRNASSKEHYSYKRSSPRKVGAEAIRAGVVVSEPGHRIGLQKADGESLYDNPDDLSQLQAEAFATDVISVFDTLDSPDQLEITSRQIGKQLLESIDDEKDSKEIIALKQLGAKICGVEKNDADYQQIISTLDTVMTADNLRDFITYLHEWSHEDTSNTEEYVNTHMNELSGFRVEASFVRLAEAAEFSIRPATRYEDHRGLDFMVENVPFDLKSSEQIAKYHAKKHKRDTYRIDAVRFVPPITSEDFDGHLVIPYEKAMTLVQSTNFKGMVMEAIHKYRETRALASTA